MLLRLTFAGMCAVPFVLTCVLSCSGMGIGLLSVGTFSNKQDNPKHRPKRSENSFLKFNHPFSGILDPKIDDFWIETVGGRILDFPKSKSGLDTADG